VDDRTFDAFWQETAAELRRLIAASGVPSHAVDDVLHDVYIAGQTDHSKPVLTDQLRRWLFRVAVNRCHLEHRRATTWRRVLTRIVGAGRERGNHQQQDGMSEPGRAAIHAEEKALVREALDRLEPPLRSMLVLRYYVEMNSREIGEIMGIPDSTVRSHLREARNRLARELQRAGYRHE
jgi:RNA polymerase sigma-70 factor, ECF subfamily